MKKSILLFLALLLVSLDFAHQPRVVDGSGIIQITNPEISQAFYGELNGSPAQFEIRSDSPFELYAGITVPAVDDAKKDFSANVSKGGSQVMFLNASSSDWAYFYEEFGGDGYYMGPEGKINAESGTYEIAIFNPSHKGRYVLVVGEKEEFPPGETVNALLLLPTLKSRFFDKSPFEAFTSKIFLFTIGPVLAIIALLALVYWFFKVRKNENMRTRKKPKRSG